MTTYNILHLSDMHYDGSESSMSRIQGFLDSMQDALKEQSIDLFAFTGDLVDKGRVKHFGAGLRLLYNGCVPLGATKRNFQICLGNHDISRGSELSATTQMIGGFQEETDLTNFVKGGVTPDLKESFRNFEVPNEQLQSFFSISKQEVMFPLIRSSSWSLAAMPGKVGVVSINTAWRSQDSKQDRGALLFPSELLSQGLRKIRDCELKICLMHHAISDLSEFNLLACEDLFYDGFHLVLSGHYHRPKQSMFFSTDEGVLLSSAAATISDGIHRADSGFTLLTVDVENRTVDINEYYYRPTTSQFVRAESRHAELPMNATKTAKRELRKVLRKKYGEELARINETFLGADECAGGFLGLFTEPIIRTRSGSRKGSPEESQGERVSMDGLVEDGGPYLILGKEKSGRTSVLRKVQLQLLRGGKELPVYVNGSYIKKRDKPYDFVNTIARYYEVSKTAAKSLIKTQGVTVLVDDYHKAGIDFHEALANFLEEFGNANFIATAEETMSRNYESYSFGSRVHKNLFVHEASRREVKSLTEKWPGLAADQRVEVVGKIEQIFRQLRIPMNYWTVSLFIWIFSRKRESAMQSNVDLVQLYVDGILERDQFIVDGRDKITYEDLKVYISHLAHYLAVNHEASCYQCSFVSLVSFTSDYHDRNKRFVVDVNNVVQGLIDKGLLKKSEDEDLYGFRLNGIFEYFLALYMSDNEKYRSDVVGDDSLYLSFANELELLAGFKRRDESFVREIFELTKLHFENLNSRLGVGINIDSSLRRKIQESQELISGVASVSQDVVKVLEEEDKDSILDDIKPLEIQQAEVERKKYYESIEENSEHLEKVLSILARVYRASDVRSDSLSDEIFEFVLDSACNLGYLIIEEGEEVESISGVRSIDKENLRALMKFMTNFIPMIVQGFLAENLLQNNMERIVSDWIARLEERADVNQFRLTLLYQSLIDVDMRKMRTALDGFENKVDYGPMKFSMLMKLYFLLMWKISEHSSNEQYLIARIEEIHKSLDANYVPGKLGKVIEESKKHSRMRAISTSS